MGETEITDHMFLFDDRHWVRWSGEQISQLAVIGDNYYAATGPMLKRIEWNEGTTPIRTCRGRGSRTLFMVRKWGGQHHKRFAELLLSAAEGARITLKTWVRYAAATDGTRDKNAGRPLLPTDPHRTDRQATPAPDLKGRDRWRYEGYRLRGRCKKTMRNA